MRKGMPLHLFDAMAVKIPGSSAIIFGVGPVPVRAIGRKADATT